MNRESMQLYLLSRLINTKNRIGIGVCVGFALLLVGNLLFNGDNNWGVPIAQAAATAPSLTIASTATAYVNSSVTVPISFVGGNSNITSIAFSINFDQTCLAFDPTD